MNTGQLYIVATPIGNLSDISQRAIDTLAQVDVIAAEDTRHSRKLINALGIRTVLVSLHDHNERSRSDQLIKKLAAGEDIALISDAGTPMISDPGYHLIRAARKQGIRVIPVPGASAVTAAASVSGLPANRFYFCGFLPERSAARRAVLRSLLYVPDTLLFYESGNRLEKSLQDMYEILGQEREAVVCKELTKVHEQIAGNNLSELVEDVGSGVLDCRGEFVVLVSGNPDPVCGDVKMLEVARRFLEEIRGVMAPGEAAALVARATGLSRKQVYNLGLDLQDD